MKKVEKGKPGYLNYKKKAEILRTVIYFAIVAAIFLLGYTQTHTRLNLMTVVAVLGASRHPKHWLVSSPAFRTRPLILTGQRRLQKFPAT